MTVGDDSGKPFEEKIGVRDRAPQPSLPKSGNLKKERFRTVTQLQKFYGVSVLVIMSLQLLIVNGLFAIYAWLGYGWAPPEMVTTFWISATFVEIVGVVTVITKSDLSE